MFKLLWKKKNHFESNQIYIIDFSQILKKIL